MGVAAITASDARHADAALVQRFRLAQTERERTAVFAAVVRQHRDAVLGCCAERLWPDADAAVAAAGDVLIAARLAMADPAKLSRPDRLQGWLLGIAASDGLTSGLRARIDDVNWEAVHAHVDADVPDRRESPASRASLRHWLDQIVATLPETRQRLFDLFVASGLDSRKAALELGTSIAEIRRLRSENRQAILRAFEVTLLAAAEAALDAPGGDAPGCGELRQILADAQRDGDPQEGGRRHLLVLPSALRLTVARHLSQCAICHGRSDDCTTQWAPELLPILAGTELNEQVMEDLHSQPELARPRDVPAAHRRVASVGTARTAVIRHSAAAAGAGLLVTLLLLAFVWPGFPHGSAALVPRGFAAPPSQDPKSGGPSGIRAPQATSTVGGVPGHNYGRQVRPGAESLLDSLPPDSTGGLAAPPSSSASPKPPAPYTLRPSAPPSSAEPTSGPSPTSSPSTTSPSPSASQPTEIPSTSPSPTSSPRTSPSPTSSPSTSLTAAPPPTPTPPSPTPSPSTSPSATAPLPTPAPSTPVPS
jgi:DNA-directed RNA polymerase specialized sigma24 family protein